MSEIYDLALTIPGSGRTVLVNAFDIATVSDRGNNSEIVLKDVHDAHAQVIHVNESVAEIAELRRKISGHSAIGPGFKESPRSGEGAGTGGFKPAR